MIRDLAFPNSAHVRAPEWLVLSRGDRRMLDIPIRYGVFRHATAGRCLIDTGYNARVTGGRRSLALRLYNALLRPRLTDAVLPAACPDATTIILTHLHADHVAALRDYPDARILADKSALKHYLGAGPGRLRHGVFAELLPADALDRVTDLHACLAIEAPLGLGQGRDVFGDGSVITVPLPGHMRGHVGVCFAQFDPPLLYAADAQWLHRAVMEDRQPGAPAAWVFDDPAAARASAHRIRAFVDRGGEAIYCHDPDVTAHWRQGDR
ncbi:MBL fold metallo-hydrolase [Maricaulis maris]|uniref:Metallo-beta-lactamase superfamily protein n=1 Tax=Maricaulis maris TaxID=74318 RepID=A0A495DKS8_9PROT|nr:MBL fold metallo-hydrolase [Maricaulis maris]RKR03219.1 metallo-beta-lactamase superfamily protein [Maricaulis maris]